MSQKAMSTPNGTRHAWAAASICSTLVAAVLGLLGAILRDGYRDDQAQMRRDLERVEARLASLDADRVSQAEGRGKTDQHLAHVESLAETNTKRLEDEIAKLDKKLQDEMRGLDSALAAHIENLDEKLQGEIGASRAERIDQLTVNRDRLEVLEAWMRKIATDIWTRSDQHEFEKQMGVRVVTSEPQQK